MKYNYIILRHDNKTYRDTLEGNTYLDVFNRPLMDIYLEKYEQSHNIKMTFDNIEAFGIFENHETVITDLPISCKYFELHNSLLKSLTVQVNVIEKIIINKSKLTQIPQNINLCLCLQELEIVKSNLTNIDSVFPNTLKKLNVRFNQITSINCETIPKHTKIIADNNNLPKDHPITYPFQNRPNQNQEYDNIHREIIQTIVRNIINPDDQITKNILENNGQTVHLSSVNKSVVKSVDVIKFFIKTNHLQINNNFINEIIDSLYPPIIEQQEVVQSSNFCFKLPTIHIENVINNINPNKLRIQNLLTIPAIQQKHSLLKLTYHELLELIWRVISFHEQKLDLIERLRTELLDSIDYCFTGRMNRLVNVLVGFIDGVHVSISRKEEIQLSIDKVIRKLPLLSKHAKEEQRKLFASYIKDVDEIFNYENNDPENKDDYISPEYKQTWIDAILDYQPEPDKLQCIYLGDNKYDNINSNYLFLVEEKENECSENYTMLKHDKKNYGVIIDNPFPKLIDVFKTYNNRIYLSETSINDESLSIGVFDELFGNILFFNIF
jgi:hypothetical protein